MEDRETARMRKYGESKTTRIMMATVTQVTSGLGFRKFQADEFLLTRVCNRMGHYETSEYPVFTSSLPFAGQIHYAKYITTFSVCLFLHLFEPVG